MTYTYKINNLANHLFRAAKEEAGMSCDSSRSKDVKA